MKNKNLLILLGFGLILGLFYWFQIRPSQIRIFCSGDADRRARELLKTLIDKPGYYERGMTQKELEDMYNAGLKFKVDYDNYYRTCLNEKGLE